MKPFILFFILCFAQVAGLTAQRVWVSGRVTDARTGEPVLFANVYLPESPSTGTMTDVEGVFEFGFDRSKGTRLEVSAIGYNAFSQKVPAGDSVRLFIRLEPSAVDLNEVVVLAGENPAVVLMRKVIGAKEANNYLSLPSFSAEKYSKLEMDVVGLPEGLTRSDLLKPFEFVFSHIDSTTEQKPFLPAYLSEELRQIYRSEGQTIDVPIARRVSNIGNESVIRFLNLVHDQFDIYSNWLNVMEKAFASPFSDHAIANYEYYLLDSLEIDGRWTYKLKFKPRRKQENTFNGECWIDAQTFAVKRLQMAKSPDVNINLLARIEVSMDFQRTADSIWAPVREHTLLEYQVAEKTSIPGVIARKSNFYRNCSLAGPSGPVREPDPRMFDPSTLDRDETYWAVHRPEPLLEREAKVYGMVDSIGKSEAYRRFKSIAYIAGSGYLPWGKVEFGPVASTYSKNSVEGNRIRFGMGSSLAFSKKVWIYGYTAYGTDDRRWKFGGHVQWQPSKRPWTTYRVSYKDDLELNFSSTGEISEDNFFAGAYRRNIPQKLMYTKQAKGYWEEDLPNGWTSFLQLHWQRLAPYAKDGQGFNFYFQGPGRDGLSQVIESAELQIRFRHAPAEIFVESNFSRSSVGYEDPRPVFEPFYILGKFGKEKYYHHVGLQMSQWFNFPPMGWLRYQINAGAITNTLPYLLLHSPTANETYFYQGNAFNTMARYEFVSDRYLDALVVHHFDGFFLNRIPLFRKLKWREVATIRMAYGVLSKKNKEANQLNHYDRNYQDYEQNPKPAEGVYYGAFDRGPLLEAGLGIENIFKILRIDATWRMNYLRNRYAVPLSLRAMFTFYI